MTHCMIPKEAGFAVFAAWTEGDKPTRADVHPILYGK